MGEKVVCRRGALSLVECEFGVGVKIGERVLYACGGDLPPELAFAGLCMMLDDMKGSEIVGLELNIVQAIVDAGDGAPMAAVLAELADVEARKGRAGVLF